MGFNYAKERRKFEAEWRKLRQEYEQAGMKPESINKIYLFDLAEFRSRRRFEIRTQPLPDMHRDTINYFSLKKNLKLLSETFDESDFLSRYAWIETVENQSLSDVLKRLLEKDLELLTLLIIEGYSQRDVAKKLHCSQNAISRQFLKIKKNLKNLPK